MNLEEINSTEVWSRLSKAENTAPGVDKLTYNHWKTVDPEGHALAFIFSLCLKFEKIPEEWKRSRTVFIPKKRIVNHCLIGGPSHSVIPSRSCSQDVFPNA